MTRWILAIILMVGCSVATRAAPSKEVVEAADREIAKARKLLPVSYSISGITIVLHDMYRVGDMLVYSMHIKEMPNDTTSPGFVSDMRRLQRSSFCNDPQYLKIMGLGFRYAYVVSDPGHRKIMDEVVTLADCKAGR
jgi:hypothetical protein